MYTSPTLKVWHSIANGDKPKTNKTMMKPKIKIVNELELVQGIQLLIAKTTTGETLYGGFVVHNEFKRFIPCGAYNSISEVKKRALQIWYNINN